MTEKQLQALIKEQVSKAKAEENLSYEKEMLLKQANLATLQSQINPHFLYNTLECMRGMALLRDEEDIADIAWSLSRFFRYSISGTSNIVTLQEELDNVRYYTKIQNYRFKNRFALKIEEEQPFGDSMLPKLTLQPVVENAILHGLQDMLEGGVVRIRSELIEGGTLRILVSDNGCGMPPEKLAELSDTLLNGDSKEGEKGRHAGIGMHNVDRRLKLYFGAEYGLTVYSYEHVGTDIELRLPYRPFRIE